MLSSRYNNNGKNIIPINDNQKKFIKIFEEKLKKKQYVLEMVNCIICDSSNFESLSQKDRYGLSMSTVICRTCGLVQTTPRMTKNSLKEFYDHEYRQIYVESDNSKEQIFQNEYNKGKVINNFINTATGKKFTKKFVVEIGAGTGGILQFFKDMENEVFGVDLDSKCVEFGKRKGVNLEVGTFEKLSNLQKKPDLVIYSQVLEHLPNPIEELYALKKFLHTDSLVHIEVPSLEHLTLSYNQNFLEYLQNAHLYHFTLNTLSNCAKKAGFKLIRGNQMTQALFKIGNSDKSYSNQYDTTLKFLNSLEILQSKPISLMKIKGKIFSIIFKILRLTRTLHIGQILYYKYTKSTDK